MGNVQIPPSKKGERWKTIAVVVLIAVIAVSFPLAVLVAYDLGEDHHGPPTFGAVQRTTLTDGVKITIVAMARQAVWDDIELEIAYDVNAVHWHPRSDRLDNHTVSVQNFAAQEIGGLTVRCKVVDCYGDGYINGGDWFELTTLEGIQFPDDPLWSVNMVNEVDDSIACSIRLTTVPQVAMAPTQIPFGYRYTLTQMDPLTSWNMLVIRLTGGLGPYGGTDSVEFALSSVNLNGTGPVTATLPWRSLGNATLFCNITDVLGDGLAAIGDYFTLTTSCEYTLQTYNGQLFYPRTETTAASFIFEGFPRDVTAQMTRNTIDLGKRITLLNVSYPVKWNDLNVSLSDGSSTVVWSVSAGFYDYNSSFGQIRFNGVTLGLLTLFLNVTWIHNTYETAPEPGDFFTLTTGSDRTFASSTAYEFALTYTHTQLKIGSMVFTA